MGVEPRKDEETADAPPFDEHVRRAYERGGTAWPGLELDAAAFEAYFLRHAGSGAPPADSLAPDMYLACACAHGVPGALERVDRILTSDVARAVRSIDPSPAFVEETLQATRERLFVAKDGRPARVFDYAGRASLRSWLCAVGVRLAISQRRRKGDRRGRQVDEEQDVQLARQGPELEYLRRRYKDAFEEALRRAIGRLAPRERLLLRLNIVEGMSLDKLAAAYGIGRSTAGRWLAHARQMLFEAVRRELHAKLKLSSAELDSLAAEIQSQLDVSVMRLLARSTGERH